MSLLEIQVIEIEEDVTGHNELINFLFDEQVIQDERLLTLEQDADQMEDDVEGLFLTKLSLWVAYLHKTYTDVFNL